MPHSHLLARACTCLSFANWCRSPSSLLEEKNSRLLASNRKIPVREGGSCAVGRSGTWNQESVFCPSPDTNDADSLDRAVEPFRMLRLHLPDGRHGWSLRSPSLYGVGLYEDLHICPVPLGFVDLSEGRKHPRCLLEGKDLVKRHILFLKQKFI